MEKHLVGDGVSNVGKIYAQITNEMPEDNLSTSVEDSG